MQNNPVISMKLVKELGANESILYSLLCDMQTYKNEYITYTNESISSDFNISENTASKILNNLAEAGLVKIKFSGVPRKRFIKVLNKIANV